MITWLINMAIKLYTSINGLAKKVKKIYFGSSDNVAVEVKKIYTSVDGVAQKTYEAIRPFTFTIEQSANQTITVTCNGVEHTENFTAYYGDTWTASVVASEGYIAGTLNISSGTATGNLSINASESLRATTLLAYAGGEFQPYNIVGELSETTAKASGCEAFSYIKYMDIGYSVTSIGGFYRNDVLASVIIPSSVTSLGDNAFYMSNKLTSITIPDSVTSIGDYVLYACRSLSSVTIGKGVTSIGTASINYCTGTVTMTSTTPPTLGSDAMDTVKQIRVPSSVLSAYQSATNWSRYASIMVGY